MNHKLNTANFHQWKYWVSHSHLNNIFWDTHTLEDYIILIPVLTQKKIFLKDQNLYINGKYLQTTKKTLFFFFLNSVPFFKVKWSSWQFAFVYPIWDKYLCVGSVLNYFQYISQERCLFSGFVYCNTLSFIYL